MHTDCKKFHDRLYYKYKLKCNEHKCLVLNDIYYELSRIMAGNVAALSSSFLYITHNEGKNNPFLCTTPRRINNIKGKINCSKWDVGVND